MTALGNAGVEEAKLIDYGDRDDFLSLWNTDGNGVPTFLEIMAGKLAAIVVWDGRVLGESDRQADRFKPHITPLDWALAFSIKTLTLPDAETRAKISIHIVDLTGEDHEKSWAMVMRHQLLVEMPWVKLHAPLIPTMDRRPARYRDGYRPILGEKGLLSSEGGAWKLNQGSTLADGVRLGGRPRLVYVGRQWAASLVQSHDHHDLNNLVGPWIVADIVPKERTPSLKAFWTRLHWTGFAYRGTERSAEEEAVKVDLDVLAVDDELAAGWDNVLVAKLLGWDAPEDPSSSAIPLIGQSANGRLFGTSNPEDMLGHLGFVEDKEPNVERYKSRAFDSPINDIDQTKPWLLVLDIRLFSGRPTKEREWFTRLLMIVQRVAEIPAAALAWDGFSLEEIRRVKAFISGSNDDAAYDTALSLLPRLCALRWPSVPVVLFSGTGRRNLIAGLAEYRNIFVAPPKPNALAGDAAEQVEMFLTGWRSKFDAAMPLVEAQRLCRQILCAAEKSEVIDRQAPSDLKHFELYLDESGSSAMADDPNAAEPESNRFLIGGVLVGYRSLLVSGPDVLHRRMETRGLRWWPKLFGEPYLVKRNAIHASDLPGSEVLGAEKILGRFLDCLNGMKPYGVCLECLDSALDEPDPLRAHWRSDNRYRFVISALLEIMLFDVLPTIVGDSSTVSIFVATRVRKAKEFTDGKASIRRLRELYGYEGTSSRFRSLNEASLLPIVLETIQRRGADLRAYQLEHVRGVRLGYPAFELLEDADHPAVKVIQKEGKWQAIKIDQSPPWRLTRHQHYVADIVANQCYRACGKLDPKSNVFRLFGAGIHDVLDLRLDAFLRAARALEIGDRSGALLELDEGDFGRAFESQSATVLLLKRLAKAVREDITGEDFCELARGMAAKNKRLSTHTPSSAVEPGIIQTYYSDKGYGFILAKRDNKKIFFHRTVWRSGTRPSDGEMIEFRRALQDDGRWQASWVHAVA